MSAPEVHGVDEKHGDNQLSPLDEKEISAVQAVSGTQDSDDEGKGFNRELPTDEELVTLRRVSDDIPWITLSIAFVELCERFSYYGTTIVCMLNMFPSFHPFLWDKEKKTSHVV